MKATTLLLFLLLSGCTANYTTQSFVYQDEKPEQGHDIDKIQNHLNDEDIIATVSAISLITKDGSTLKGVKLINKDALVNIVFFSANGMKIKTSSKILNKFSLLPANVIWFDYRGMGASDKKDILSLANLQTDALSIVDFSKTQLPTHIPFITHGLSMGSLIASYVANNRNVDALILDGAIHTVPELVDNLIPGWSKPFYTINLSPELANISNGDAIKSYKNPLLLLVGEDDSTTPVVNSQELLNLSGSKIKELAIIPDIGHGETMRKAETIEVYKQFIKQITCCVKQES